MAAGLESHLRLLMRRGRCMLEVGCGSWGVYRRSLLRDQPFIDNRLMLVLILAQWTGAIVL